MTELDYFSLGMKSVANWKPIPSSETRDIQVIDLFCGAGGMSLGFAALGEAIGAFQVIGGGDINKASLSTFEQNFGVPGVEVDVSRLANEPETMSNFLKSINGYDPNKKTVLIGCAPCQGFSAHRKKNWDKPDDRNSLVEAFAKVCAILKPDCIIMENVPELLSKKYWHHFEAFEKTVKEQGYIVKHAIHNAAEHFVPQQRQRSIVMAMKQEFSLPRAHLTKERFRTVRDAIGDLPPVEAGKIHEHDRLHKSAAHRASTIDVIRSVPRDGGSRPKGIGPKCLQDFKGFSDVYGRLSWDKPSITITHYARNPASGRFVHPHQDRGLTAREAARLQSFPDGFEFSGGFDDIFRQIGEAVPPLLSLGVAACVLDNLDHNITLDINNTVEEPLVDQTIEIQPESILNEEV